MSYNTVACPHSNGKGAPVCWDCSEQSWGSPPPFDDLGGIKLKILGGKNQAFAPEVHPPAEGIEVGTPNSRYSQPGLEVFTGPQIVPPVEKYRYIGTDEKIVVNPITPAPTILGFRRRVFWFALICVVLVLTVGVAVGVVVGITQKNKSAKAQLASSSSIESGGPINSTSSPAQIMTEIVSVITASPSMATTSSPVTQSASSLSKLVTSSSTEKKLSPSPSPSSVQSRSTAETSKSVEQVTVISVQTASATTNPVQSTPSPVTVTVTPTSKTSTQATASPTTSSSDGDCLGANGSTYTDSGTGSQWKIECDTAHQGKDIDNYEAETMEACVSMCASDSDCVGAIWYSAGPQGTDLNYCWLKSTLEDSLKSTKDAQSVVRL